MLLRRPRRSEALRGQRAARWAMDLDVCIDFGTTQRPHRANERRKQWTIAGGMGAVEDCILDEASQYRQCVRRGSQTVSDTDSGSAIGIGVNCRTLRRPYAGCCPPSAPIWYRDQ
jgi:hypothetical protein